MDAEFFQCRLIRRRDASNTTRAEDPRLWFGAGREGTHADIRMEPPFQIPSPWLTIDLVQETPVSHDGEKAVEKLRAVIERLAPSQNDPRASGPPGAFDVYVVEYLQVVRHEADGSD